MERVLVTGGAGFIGSHLTDLLVARGHPVTVIDSLEPQVHRHFPGYLNSGAHYQFDRLHSRRLDYAALLKGIDTIFYLASKVGPTQSMTDIADYMECNVRSLGYLLQQVLEHGDSVRRFILSASMGPYGEGRYACSACAHRFYPAGPRTGFEYTCPHCGAAAHNLPLDESTEIHNISYYGLTKNVQEEMLTLFARAWQRELVSLRYFSVYGDRQTIGNPYGGPIPIWIGRARNHQELQVHEDGLQTRDFIYVKDLAEITYRAGSLPLPAPVEVINCGTGRATRIIEVANHIRHRLGAEGQVVVTGTIRPGDLRHSLCDNRRLKERFHFDQFVSVFDGLDDFIPQQSK